MKCQFLAGLLLAVAGFTVMSLPVNADESRPIYIHVTEPEVQVYHLQWKIPPTVPYFAAPMVSFPKVCEQKSQLAETNGQDGVVRRITYQCPESLAGESLSITYPGANPSTSSLIRFSNYAGQQYTEILGPDETRWTIPTAETPSTVALDYTVLGMEHIWGGIDHLLFLVCLLWIAGTWKRVLVTITGFTLSHSATLIMSALNIVTVPIAPVEAVIALSIVFLATEIAKGKRNSLTWKYPIAVSSSFGLLHGFGFAAALSEIGLPQTELLTGLLFFNVGVEIGQVLFAAAAISLIWVLTQISSRWFRDHQMAAIVFKNAVIYSVGILSTYWLVERCTAFV